MRSDKQGNGTQASGARFVDDYLAYLLAQASQRISAEFHQQVKAAGLSVTEWRVLASLEGSAGETIGDLAPRDYDLAVETVNCRRLVKGYSDTHVRGGGKYRQLIAAAAKLAGRPDAAASLRALRQAALADEKCGPMERQLAEKLAA